MILRYLKIIYILLQLHRSSKSDNSSGIARQINKSKGIKRKCNYQNELINKKIHCDLEEKIETSKNKKLLTNKNVELDLYNELSISNNTEKTENNKNMAILSFVASEVLENDLLDSLLHIPSILNRILSKSYNNIINRNIFGDIIEPNIVSLTQGKENKEQNLNKKDTEESYIEIIDFSSDDESIDDSIDDIQEADINNLHNGNIEIRKLSK